MAVVLIADDRPANRDLLRTLLASRGHTVVEAATGREAITLARRHVPDLVITDILMPEVDGYEVARTIRADPALAATRVAFYTANYVEAEVRPVAEACGVRWLIPKSVDPAISLAAAEQALAALPPGESLEASEDFAERHLRALNAKLMAKVDELEATRVALFESETRLRRIMAMAPVGIFTLDADGRCTYVNPWFPALFGHPVERFLGRAWVDLLVDDDRERVETEVEAAVRAGAAWQLECRVRAADDRELVLHAHGVPVHDDDGQVTGFVGTADDLTGAVDAQRQRDELAARLSVSERLEALGQLAGGVAHDFNNVLGVVLNYTTFVEDAVHRAFRDGFDRETYDAACSDLAAVQDATHRAAQLTQQLLAFGRRDLVASEVVDLAALLGQLQDLLARTIGEHIVLAWDIAPDLQAVRGDPTRLEQIVVNLVVNARDAVGDAGRITVTATNAVVHDEGAGCEPGEYVRLRVADNGEGMAPETVAHIFEPFFTTKPLGLGTGLGLATVYGIVTQMGGGLEVDSALGEGTAITVSLPATGAALLGDEVEPGAIPAGRGESILVVEDELGLRASTARVLTSYGYAVTSAPDATAALEIVDQAGRPDLVITDMVMPGMSGRALAQALRARWPDVRVVYMSGYPEGVTPDDVGSGGMTLLRKPISAELLVRSVADALAAPAAP